MRNRLIACLIVTAVATLPLRAQKLAAGVDVLWLSAGMPSAGAEMSTGRATTLGLSVAAARFPWIHHHTKGVVLQPEWRYYLSGRPMYHHFVGLGGIVGSYDVTFDDSQYVGTAAGVGLTFGYVVVLSERLNLDLHSGMGIIHTQDRSRGHDNYTLPTKAGITLTYIFR